MKKLYLLSTIILVASSLISSNLSAAIYTWTDKDGKVHFSDKPISNENVTTIKPNENGNISKTGPQNNQWQEDYNKAKQDKVKKAKKEALQANITKSYCNNLKSKLAIYRQSGRLYVMSSSGERNYQSEEQRSVTKKNLTNKIKENCR